MAKYSITEIVEMAVQTERLGFDFYIAMAKKFEKDKGICNLFIVLAEKEKKHEKTFIELEAGLGEAEADMPGWDEAQSYFMSVMESEFFLGKGKSLPNLSHIKTVTEAVSFALGFEKETLLYFVGIRDFVREKEVVDEIINEEKSHIMWLNKFKSGM